MLKRLILVFALTFAPAPALADAAGVRDRIVTMLREDGFTEIRLSRTLLGRMRFVATRPDAEREIVVNPGTGVILRDYVRLLKRRGSDDDDDDDERTDDDEDDDYDDDDDDEDDDEDDDDESDDDDEDDDDEDEDNSGSGSSNSGSGSDDDD